MSNHPPGTNEFYNINKLPATHGICVYGISMALIDKAQSPPKLFDQAGKLIDKIQKPTVGDVIVYTDNLYLYSQKPAHELKQKFQRLIEEHKRGYLKLIEKNIYLITQAFSFTTWSQLVLDTDDFTQHLRKLQAIYETNQQFKELVKQDITQAEKPLTKNTINYLLEEILLDYLVAKQRTRLQNDYVQDKEKWVLHCYPGKPHRSYVYLHQQNILELESNNPYEQAWYDLRSEKLYEFERLDINTFNFTDDTA